MLPLLKYEQIMCCTFATDEVKPLLSNLNLDDALLPQLGVDGGELPTQSVIVDHLLDDAAKVSCLYFLASYPKDIAQCKFTLVAFC